ncbi:hypothetical protein [Pradoshia sp.]
MKKYIITLGTAILIGIGGYLLAKEARAEPPKPVIAIGEEKVPAVRGTYCWSSLMKSICEDKAAPPGIIAIQEQKPLSAAPGTEVTIDFDEKPLNESVDLSRWLNDEESLQVRLIGNRFVLPKESGTYVYGVSASWNNGDAVYAFEIEVK